MDVCLSAGALPRRRRRSSQRRCPYTVRCRVGLEGATVYDTRAVTNVCHSEGHLKPCDVKMPIAMSNSSWDGAGALGAVVRCTTQPRGGGKMHIKEQFRVQAPLKYTWHYSC